MVASLAWVKVIEEWAFTPGLQHVGTILTAENRSLGPVPNRPFPAAQ